MFIAVRTGLEPATPGVTGPYSNQLNYRTNIFKNFVGEPTELSSLFAFKDLCNPSLFVWDCKGRKHFLSCKYFFAFF